VVVSRRDFTIHNEDRAKYLNMFYYRRFKNFRLMAMSQAIVKWASSPHRCHSQAIDLMVVLVYMINALQSRPVDMRAENDMVRSVTSEQCWQTSILQYNENEGEEDGLIEIESKRLIRGLFCPADIIGRSTGTNAPHLGSDFVLVPTIYTTLFGAPIASLKHKLHKLKYRIVRQETRSEEEPNTNSVITRRPRRSHRHPGPSGPDDMVQLSTHDVRFSSRMESSSRRDNERAVSDLSVEISRILARFYSDILMCSPNQGHPSRNDRPYCRLALAARKTVTASDFKNRNLAAIWHKCMIIEADQHRWDESFNHLFPLGTESGGGVRQNFNQCEFYTSWVALIETYDDRVKDSIRAKLKASDINESFLFQM
jgi:hypothetical protein